MMGYLHHHLWLTEGPDVWRCSLCDMYRCYAWREARMGSRMGEAARPQRVVEYSTADGEVVCVDPKYVPECDGRNDD